MEDMSFATNLRVGAIVFDVPRIPIEEEELKRQGLREHKVKCEKSRAHMSVFATSLPTPGYCSLRGP